MEYKACGALQKSDKKKNEISKDISSFANSDGGQIIYGINEEENKPVSIDEGFDPNNISKEWLEQIINSRISPKIDGIRIFSIDLVNSKCIYLVEIPKSTRAPHQAYDNKYYKRRNFIVEPMEEYEVKEKYLSNILSQTEFKRLQAQVREKLYKPLYIKIKNLREKLNKERQPDIFYYDENPYFPEYVEDESLYCHDFRFWREIKYSGEWLDMYGIGDNDLYKALENLLISIEKYNALNKEFIEKVKTFITGFNEDDYSWDILKDEIFNYETSIKKIKTIKLLRTNKEYLSAEAPDLPDDEIFEAFISDFINRFPLFKLIKEISKEIYKEVEHIIQLIEIKIKITYPTK